MIYKKSLRYQKQQPHYLKANNKKSRELIYIILKTLNILEEFQLVTQIINLM